MKIKYHDNGDVNGCYETEFLVWNKLYVSRVNVDLAQKSKSPEQFRYAEDMGFLERTVLVNRSTLMRAEFEYVHEMPK